MSSQKQLIGVLLLACVQFAAAQSMDRNWEMKLSQPKYRDNRFRMFQVPMPDGLKLSAAVWIPEPGNGAQFPTILAATPYNKLAAGHIQKATFFVPRGYAYVAYDIRGRYDSEGQAYLYGDSDGNALNVMQAWITSQQWSSGT